MKTKQCSKCLSDKPLTAFSARSDATDGHRGDCKECAKEYGAAWAKRNPEKMAASSLAWAKRNPEKMAASMRAYRSANPEMGLIKGAKQRAKEHNLPFDLENYSEALKCRLESGVCELTGLPFVRGVRKRTPFSPTLDRIIPSLGYVFSNIRIVIYAVNVLMGDWGEATALDICRAWIRRQGEKERE